MSLWPALPVELKRLILELVALDDIDDARSLRLVSRDINVLVLPIVFYNVVIEYITDVAGLSRTILPPPALHHKLRNRKPEPPRLLSTYNTTSLALLLSQNLPSIEDALAAVGPAFSRLRYLAITSRNLSSNAFWLRSNDVRPTHLMLLHHGSPRPVNWRDPILCHLTHLFTSSLDSHGPSTLSDLTNLTHIAVQTHAELSDDHIRYIVDKLEWILDVDHFPNLQALVLALERFPKPPPPPPPPLPPPPLLSSSSSSLRLSRCKLILSAPAAQDTATPAARERYLALLSRWRTHLHLCFPSGKFYILPDPYNAQTEWDNWIHRDWPDIWLRASRYREQYPNSSVLDPRDPPEPELQDDLDRWLSLVQAELLQFDPSLSSPTVSEEGEGGEVMVVMEETPRKRRYHHPKIHWEIDLIQREGYRESNRLDPEEAGEYEHVLGGF